MPTDTAEMKDTVQQSTSTGTSGPEHHQTQAATGSPQAGGARTASPTAATMGGTATSGMASATTGATASGGPSVGTATARRGISSMLPTPPFGNPFGVMRSFMDQMDRFFDDFMGLGGGRSRQPGLSPAPQAAGPSGASGMASLWYPQIEVTERNGNLVICADLPGMRKEDVHLEVHDNYLALQGERHQEQQGGQEGYFRSERSYGRFFRTVPLPEGINPDQARASFKDGVLEVTVPLPNREQKQGRRIEIQ